MFKHYIHTNTEAVCKSPKPIKIYALSFSTRWLVDSEKSLSWLFILKLIRKYFNFVLLRIFIILILQYLKKLR